MTNFQKYLLKVWVFSVFLPPIIIVALTKKGFYSALFALFGFGFGLVALLVVLVISNFINIEKASQKEKKTFTVFMSLLIEILILFGLLYPFNVRQDSLSLIVICSYLVTTLLAAFIVKMKPAA